MNLIAKLQTQLDVKPRPKLITIKRKDVQALIDFVLTTEEFRKAYFCDENFGRSTKEHNEAWYQARVALGLK